MKGSLFYGLKGRVISGVAFIAGALSAAVAAAQQASLVSIFPAQYNKWFTAAAVISLFVTAFSERVQGGASKPDVRIAAQQSDNKNEIEATNK
jgi:hypothetical protein